MNQIANDMLADEDMGFLEQIAQSLTARYGNYRINLSNNSVLTNNINATFTFTGLDQIAQAKQQLAKIMPAEKKFQLIMPISGGKREKIGEMWGMVIIADPNCPPEQFLIQPFQEAT